MKTQKPPDIQLVVTVALKKEVPKEWFQSHHVPVHTLSALRAGALNRLNSSDRGMLVVVTGCGPEAGEEAALWIKNNLDPLFVLNIGTCGLTDKRRSLRTWIRPRNVSNEDSAEIELDTRLPVPAPLQLKDVHSLISVQKADFNAVPPSWKRHDAIDMECYAQAKIFSGTPISFHCLKFGTDYSDRNAAADFNAHLELFVREMKTLFNFLEDGKTEITVVIPVYNREHTIRQAVDSVLKQTLQPEEIIVVNDCSTDGTKEILNGYEKRITSIHLNNNSGPSRARNAAIKHAKTEWIAFLDSDDSWKKDKLKTQVQFLRKYPFYQIMQSEEMWIRNGVRVNPHKHHRKPSGWIWGPSLERCLVSPSGVLIKKSLLKQYGCFDEALPVCEDYDLWLKISRNHPVGLDPGMSVVKYGGHRDQLSRKYPAMDRFRAESLYRLLGNELLPRFRREITVVLEKKLGILVNGCEKRKKSEEVKMYREMLESIKKYR